MLLMTENEANNEKLRKTKETNNNIPKWPTSWADNRLALVYCLVTQPARFLRACLLAVRACVCVSVSEQEQKRMLLSEEHEKVKVN